MIASFGGAEQHAQGVNRDRMFFWSLREYASPTYDSVAKCRKKGALPEFMNAPSLFKFKRNRMLGVPSLTLKLYDYAEARQLMRNPKKEFPTIRSIFVSWDNTPRRGRNGIIIVNATPRRFEEGFAEMVHEVQHGPHEERLIFLNAWNAWAEGDHLEPDLKNGEAYLAAVGRVRAVTVGGMLSRTDLLWNVIDWI